MLLVIALRTHTQFPLMNEKTTGQEGHRPKLLAPLLLFTRCLELSRLGNERESLSPFLNSLVGTHARKDQWDQDRLCADFCHSWGFRVLLRLLYPAGLMRSIFLLRSMVCAGVSAAAAERGLLHEAYKLSLIKHSTCSYPSAPSPGEPHKQQPSHLTKCSAAHLTQSLC